MKKENFRQAKRAIIGDLVSIAEHLNNGCDKSKQLIIILSNILSFVCNHDHAFFDWIGYHNLNFKKINEDITTHDFLQFENAEYNNYCSVEYKKFTSGSSNIRFLFNDLFSLELCHSSGIMFPDYVIIKDWNRKNVYIQEDIKMDLIGVLYKLHRFLRDLGISRSAI